MKTRKVTREYTNAAQPLNRVDATERERRLLEDGAKWLGAGTRATAYSHPTDPNRVIRLGIYDGRKPRGKKGPVDGWLEYFNAFSGSRSRHFPRVYSVKLFKNFYEVEMERLDETHEVYDDDFDEFKDFPQSRSLQRFLDRLGEAGADNETGASEDYHAGNFMVRPSTGDIVVTDPWYIPRD